MRSCVMLWIACFFSLLYRCSEVFVSVLIIKNIIWMSVLVTVYPRWGVENVKITRCIRSRVVIIVLNKENLIHFSYLIVHLLHLILRFCFRLLERSLRTCGGWVQWVTIPPWPCSRPSATNWRARHRPLSQMPLWARDFTLGKNVVSLYQSMRAVRLGREQHSRADPTVRPVYIVSTVLISSQPIYLTIQTQVPFPTSVVTQIENPNTWRHQAHTNLKHHTGVCRALSPR